MAAGSAKDPLRLLEAAYSFVPSEEVWLRGIVDALAPYDLGCGVAGYVSALGAEVSVRAVATRNVPMDPSVVHQMAAWLPAPFYRRIHAPMPVMHSSETFPAAVRELGMGFGDRWPGETPFPVPRAAWAISGGDAGIETALVTFHCEDGQAFSARDKHVLDCFAAHLGSALRLRSLLGEAPTGDHAAVDAVLSPDGRVLDARGDAREEAERAPLLEAVRRSQKAKLRSATPEERLDVWTALVEGRWSILESEERDGKRTLLACRNEPRTSAMRALTARERSVVTYAALGHSFKYIAYELGIALPTAAANLESALRKLGLGSRAELIQLLSRGEQG